MKHLQKAQRLSQKKLKNNFMIIAGLGNPGAQYSTTRHNVGFLAVDYMVDRLNFSYKNSSKFKCEIASGNFEGTKIHFVKPQTFMNLSGESLTLVKNYYNESNEDIIIIYDEIDLEFSKIRHKIGGGSAGHNGIKSIDKHIGEGYNKLRIGVGRPPHKDMQVSDYVLSNFSNEELKNLEDIFESFNTSFSQLINKDFASIISKK